MNMPNVALPVRPRSDRPRQGRPLGCAAVPANEPTSPTSDHAAEVATGERFAFGENWARFLAVLDDERIVEAERSLEAMLGPGSLRGASFLDIGCGSGLFSLAAMRLGASRVHSLDFDSSSVGCALELRRRNLPDASAWTIGSASALDAKRIDALGRFDVVYSWGVLHHTGDMWRAMENAMHAVAPCGRLFISIYNDQGFKSRVWRRIKRLYNALPSALRVPFALLVMAPLELRAAVAWTVRGKPWRYVQGWTRYKQNRGMSRWHDLVDWVGGYPFEVATPDAVFDFCRDHGFALERLITRQGLGCNEFVLRRSAEAAP
jgi:2-polyprenyl-3-methyl-5-hydroxy-6-metoxy-1,4-benzoquinol methylase